jgi:predicted NBD/HSP70 family sugar kinase
MTERKKLITHKKMKHDTLMQIIDAVREGYNTKKSIQRKIGFSWGTCSESINDLERMQILFVDSQSNSGQPGPKSKFYSISHERYLIMGMEVAPKRISCTVASMDGSVIDGYDYPVSEEIDNFNAYRILREAFFRTLKKVSLEEEKIYAVGFVLTGAIDRQNMKWIQSPLFRGIKDLDFNAFFSHFPSVRHIYISHDVQARAMNVTFSQEISNKDFVMLHVSDGLGMAAYENGRSISGHRGLAGEIGHIPYLGDSIIPGSVCFCGKKKCLETFVKYANLIDFYNERTGKNIEDFADADPDSPAMDELYGHLESLLLYTCNILVNIFDTSCLMIGGKCVDPWLDRFRESFFTKLKSITWEEGPEEILWIEDHSASPSHGTCLLHLDELYSCILQEYGENETME